MAGVRLLLSRWRADVGLLVLLAVVLGSIAGTVGAVPRLLDRLERDSLDDELERATPDRRGLAANLILERGLPRGDGVWDDLEERGRALAEEEVAPALDELLAPPVPVVDTLRWRVLEPPGGDPVDAFERRLTVRSQADLPGFRLVAGRLPDGLVDSATWETGAVDEDGQPVTETAPVHEILLTPRHAEAMNMAVGDQRRVAIDPDGQDLRRLVVVPATATAVIELAGVVELPPVGDPVWFGDPRLHRPSQFDTGTNTTFFSFGIVPRDAVGELPGSVDALPVSVQWRWQLDEQALLTSDASAAADAALALRTTPSFGAAEPLWSTGLDRIVQREEARRATAVEALGLVVVAVVAVGIALLAAVSVVLAGRRRDAVALVRGRGASTGQVVAAGALEALVVAAVGLAVAGTVLALLLPGRGGEAFVAGVTTIGVLVLVGAAWPDARRPLGGLLARRRRGGGVRSQGRPVLEGLVVLLALVALLAVGQRGARVDGQVDPLVVAAPVALALAGAVLAARVLPVVLRVVGPLVVRTSLGLATPLGVARATRQRRGGPVVLLITLGVGIAAVSLAAHAAVVGGQDRAASERVGADVRIEAPPLSTLRPDWSPPGVDDVVADVGVVDGLLVGPADSQSVDVLLVDATELAAIAEELALPSLAWDGVRPAPVLLSSPRLELGGVDTDLSLQFRGARVGVVPVATVPRLLGFDTAEDGLFVVVEREAVTAVTGDRVESSVRLVRTDDPQGVVGELVDLEPDAEVLVRSQVRAGLAAAPLGRGVRVGFLVAAAAVGTATLLAVVLALAAAAPVRRQEAAVLAAIGTPRRRIAQVAVVEVVPVVAAAALLGVALAVGIALLLRSSLDLAVFTGTASPTVIGPPPLVWTSLLVVLVLVVVAAAAVVTIGRVDTAALLREGE